MNRSCSVPEDISSTARRGRPRGFWRENPVYASDGRNDYAERYSADLSFRDEEAARRSVAVIDDLYKRLGTASRRSGGTP